MPRELPISVHYSPIIINYCQNLIRRKINMIRDFQNFYKSNISSYRKYNFLQLWKKNIMVYGWFIEYFLLFDFRSFRTSFCLVSWKKRKRKPIDISFYKNSWSWKWSQNRQIFQTRSHFKLNCNGEKRCRSFSRLSLLMSKK